VEPTEISIKQAELIIHLYELRREPVMRLARSYVGGRFLPTSLNSFLEAMAVHEQGAYVLQVYGYWDMVSSMVFHGALNEDLVYDCCAEMYFQYAKIRPFLEEFRTKNSLPGLFVNLQKLVEGSEKGRARLEAMDGYLNLCLQAADQQPSPTSKQSEKPDA
jgi:hypothetical protein